MQPSAPPPPSDRYVVVNYLAEGGMGAIYVGKKLGAGGFEREVVLKQLLPEFTKQEEFIDLFLREAKLSATLDHANIVQTIDLVTTGEDYFIVMEYLPGGDLRTLLKRAKRYKHRLSPSAAMYIAREALAALAYAHAKRDERGTHLKLIHRDVSPSNLLVSAAGEVKLTDFGIAKAATHTSMFYRVKGKVGYMSPEQAKSDPLDHRSDLYSVGVCLYELLTGARLFVHEGLLTSADEIYSQAVPELHAKYPEIPADLDAILHKALAITPAERYQSAGQFAEALTRCAHRHGLLYSAQALADELERKCGPTETWRDDNFSDELEPAAAGNGTAVLSPEDDDDDDAPPARAPAMTLAPPRAPVLAPAPPAPPRTPRQSATARYRSPAYHDRQQRDSQDDNPFAGRELTSIVKIFDEEGHTSDRILPLPDLSAPIARASHAALSGEARNATTHGAALRASNTHISDEASPDDELDHLVTALPTFRPAPPFEVPPPRPSAAALPAVERAAQARLPTVTTQPHAWRWVVIALLVIGLVVATIVGFSGPSLG